MVIYCSVSVCSSKENGLPPIPDEVYCYYQNLSFLEERIGCHKFKESGKFGPLFHWMQAYREMLPKQITESPSVEAAPPSKQWLKNKAAVRLPKSTPWSIYYRKKIMIDDFNTLMTKYLEFRTRISIEKL